MAKSSKGPRDPPTTRKRAAGDSLTGKERLKRIQTKSPRLEVPQSQSNPGRSSSSPGNPKGTPAGPASLYSTDGEASDYQTDLGDDLSEDDADVENVDEDEEPERREPRTPSKRAAAFKKAACKMALLATKSRNKTIKQVSYPPNREIQLTNENGSRAPRTPRHSRKSGVTSEITPSSSIAPRSSQPASGSESESTLPDGRTRHLDGEEITGRAAAVLKHAEAIMYRKTLTVNAFSELVLLTSWTVESWNEAEYIMGGPEYQSARERTLVRVL